MSFITYGYIDKKLLLLIIITVDGIINIFIVNNDETSNGLLCSLEEEIGSIIAGLILYRLFRHKISKSGQKKRSFIHLLNLFLLRTVRSSYEQIFPYVVTDRKYRFSSILNTTNGLEILAITGATFLILKYKYHIHHMISMTVFCALGISMDILLDSFSIKFSCIYIYIISIANEVLVYCYLKYMMDKLYYQYTEIILYWGLIGLVEKIIIFSGLSIYEYVNNIDGYLFEVKKYFEETNVASIIFIQFFYYILDGGIYNSLIALLLFYLRPNHLIITDEIYAYLNMILYGEKPNKGYSVIIFAFQMLALLFYFEILELNFCGLNKNTAKNIQEREKKDQDIDTDDSRIELEDQYIVKNETMMNDDDEDKNKSVYNNIEKYNSKRDDEESFMNNNLDENFNGEISQKN